MSHPTLRRDLGFALLGLAVLLALPWLFHAKALTDFVIRLCALAVYATSLNLLIGYGGLVSFGHGMFYGLGAYSFALSMQRLGVSIPVAALITLVLSALVALGVGAICLRLKEIYFSFLTLAFQMLLHSLIIAWTDVTGGDQGLTGGVPRPPFLGIALDHPYHLYAFCCVVMVAALMCMRHLLQSPFGYTLRMTRDNPVRAGFMGIRVQRIQLLAFVVAGVFGSVGGILMSLFVSSAYPDFAYWTISGEAVFVILLGGMNVFLGPLVGSAIMLLLNDSVTRVTEHYNLVLGAVIVTFALGLRKGLLGLLVERLWRRGGGR